MITLCAQKTLTTNFLPYFFANKKQKTERYYLAITVSASLERFISKCLSVVCNDGDYDDHRL